MVRIAVLDDYQGVAEGCANWDLLDADVEFFADHLADRDAIVERLRSFEVVVAMRERTPFPREVLSALSNLRLLVTTGMRNAAIDLEAARDLGITVSGTASSGVSTAELTFAFVHMLARGLPGEIESIRTGGWQVGLGRDLRGSVLGVVGLGRIGSMVAGYGNAFGMEVIAWSENLTDDRCGEVGASRVSKPELLAGSDFVTLHLKLSDRSRGVIGRSDLEAMRPTSYLVNTSRGPLVDTDALLEALSTGSIAGAAIDVFEPEPLPADHPLRHHPKILATPHIGYVTSQTYAVFYPEVVEDIEAWIAGDPIRLVT